MSEPEVDAHVPVGDVEEATIVSDRDALYTLSSSQAGRGMRCSTGRMENSLCGSVWYQ